MAGTSVFSSAATVSVVFCCLSVVGMAAGPSAVATVGDEVTSFDDLAVCSVDNGVGVALIGLLFLRGVCLVRGDVESFCVGDVLFSVGDAVLATGLGGVVTGDLVAGDAVGVLLAGEAAGVLMDGEAAGVLLAGDAVGVLAAGETARPGATLLAADNDAVVIDRLTPTVVAGFDADAIVSGTGVFKVELNG